MESIMENATICLKQEYCTDCPIRAKCKKRITFYNKKQFFEELEKTCVIASVAISRDATSDIIAMANVLFIEKMLKKRNRELQEQPIYSNY